MLFRSLRIQATLDPLTGLCNRRAILETLDNELVRASRQGLSLSLMIVDLDHFKAVNDTFGHQVGDQVLQETAGRIRATLQPYDTLGRYGGEEFLIVAPGCDAAKGAAVAERLRAALISEPIISTAGPIVTTACFGVASNAGVETIDAANLIRAADEVLYWAKAAGRNRVEVASQPEPLVSPVEDQQQQIHK